MRKVLTHDVTIRFMPSVLGAAMPALAVRAGTGDAVLAGLVFVLLFLLLHIMWSLGRLRGLSDALAAETRQEEQTP